MQWFRLIARLMSNDHLTQKISLGIFQESSSFEGYSQFSKIYVLFLNEGSFLCISPPFHAWIMSPLLPLFGLTTQEILEKFELQVASGVTTALLTPQARGGTLGGQQIAAPEPTSTPFRYQTCLLTSSYQVYFKL